MFVAGFNSPGLGLVWRLRGSRPQASTVARCEFRLSDCEVFYCCKACLGGLVRLCFRVRLRTQSSDLRLRLNTLFEVQALWAFAMFVPCLPC